MNARDGGLLLALAAALAAPPSALAQRARVPFAWQGRTAELEYGVVAIGKHTVDELLPGTTWRLGKDRASTLATEMPLIGGDGMVSPGSYAVAVARGERDDFSLFVDGAGAAIGGREVCHLPGVLSRDERPAGKLEIRWAPDPQKPERGPNRETLLRVFYGPYVLTVPVLAVGGSIVRLPGWEITLFTVPVEALERRLARGWGTTVAGLRRTGRAPARAAAGGPPPQRFNLVLEELGFSLIPAMRANPADNGFAPPEPPPREWVRTGELTWTEAPDAGPCVAITMERAPEGGFACSVAAGKQAARFLVPDPFTPPGGAAK